MFSTGVSTISVKTFGDKYFRFDWPYYDFQLSVVVEITVFELTKVDSFVHVCTSHKVVQQQI